MNILPKKSWHVRNKDNVARVRKDEARAAEEELGRRKRVELAEQEARTDFLRRKARLGQPQVNSSDDGALVERDARSDHINLFQAVEEGGGTNKGNKEYEEEKRKEKERQEKALGILTYLGQSASEAQTSRPWYQEVPSRSEKEVDNDPKDDKRKRRLDPINDMEKYLQKKHKAHKEHKKEKRKESKGTHKPSIEELRRERLKREAAERARAEALLSGKKDLVAPEQEMDDRKRQYNSQFFPQLARKPKPRDEQNR